MAVEQVGGRARKDSPGTRVAACGQSKGMLAICASLAQEDIQGLWAWWPKAGLGMHVLLISKMCIVLVDASGQVAFRPHAQGHTGAKMVHSLVRLKRMPRSWGLAQPAMGSMVGHFWGVGGCLGWAGLAALWPHLAWKPAHCLGARRPWLCPALHEGAESRSGWCRAAASGSENSAVPAGCVWGAAAAWGWALTQ